MITAAFPPSAIIRVICVYFFLRSETKRRLRRLSQMIEPAVRGMVQSEALEVADVFNPLRQHLMIGQRRVHELDLDFTEEDAG